MDGAIYTPPFLVDFVLSKVERDGTMFGRNDRVFDCAAGSGLFLVGGFRRIIESSLRRSARADFAAQRAPRAAYEVHLGSGA